MTTKITRRASAIRIKRTIAERKGMDWREIYAAFTLAGRWDNSPRGLGFTPTTKEGLRRALNRVFADVEGHLTPAEMREAKRVGHLYIKMWSSIPDRYKD